MVLQTCRKDTHLTASPSSHWITHAGPNNWFSIAYPPAWQLETRDGTTRLLAPDNAGNLTLNCFWLDEPQPSVVDKILDLDRLFPRRRKVQTLKTAVGGRGQCAGYQGETLVGGERPWWRRIFRRKKWLHWRVWCIHCGSVYVLATYEHSGKVDHEAETLASMIVGSVAFAEQPACPPEIFADRVLALARRKFPLLDCETVPDFQLKLGESKVNLLNFYRSYVNAPAQFEAIVLPALTTVVQVQGWGREQTEPGLDDVRSRIMPMLYPEDVWKETFPNFVGVPWVGGLVILYVVDESNAYWYIRDDLLELWQLSLDDLHEIALENVEEYFEKSPMQFTVAGEEGPRLLLPQRPDAYNTSHLLSHAFHETLRGVLGGDFVVGTPNRDFFVAVSLDSAETIDHVRKKVEDDFQQMDHPLSDRLLLVTHDGVTEYVPWE